VTLRPDELPAPDATSLAIEQAACTDRDPLLRALLRALDSELRQWCQHRGDPITSGLREAYQQCCATLGEQVRVELPGQPELIGTAEDIDADGRLVVLSGEQRRALSVGDVTHVRSGSGV
jgi:BirA family biotin operon repressor/biotin-[acetyl-CoA-carboxylase] ligase